MKQDLPKKLPLEQIIVSDEIQSRVALNGESIKEYAKRIDAGDKFPAVIVYHDEDAGTYLLADGFHRVEAHKKIGRTEINVEVKVGGKSDALMYGIIANVKHGLHRSNADKKRSVMLLLKDEKWNKELPKKEIARKCGVSSSFVGTVEKELSINGEKIDSLEYRKVVRNEKEYYMKVVNIGKAKKTSSKQESPLTPELSNIVDGNFGSPDNRLQADMRTLIKGMNRGDLAPEIVALMKDIAQRLLQCAERAEHTNKKAA